MTAEDLRELYEILYQARDSLTAAELAEQTGLSLKEVDLGLEKLVQAGYVSNGAASLEDARFTTEL